MFFLADGSHPTPIGWRASARNNASEAKEMKIAAICYLPEPSTLQASLAVILSIALISRRRRPASGSMIVGAVRCRFDLSS